MVFGCIINVCEKIDFRLEEILMEKKIMLGNEAIARGAYEAGVKVSASMAEMEH